jgi:hypothetical protein
MDMIWWPATRRRRVASLLASIIVIGGVGVATPVSKAAETAPPPNAVVRWNRAVLRAIEQASPGPTIAARAVAVLHTCMYDAWAAYDPVAVGTRLGGALRRPTAEQGPAEKAAAMSYAAHLAAVDLFPHQVASFDEQLRDQGFDPANASTDTTTPAGVGRVACQSVLDFRHRDGANQLGDQPASSGIPYSDYTGYVPVNGPDRVSDPDRWQPLQVATASGTTVQQYLTPHWNRVAPFAVDPQALSHVTGPNRFGTAGYQLQADEILGLSAGLTDEQKAVAEYWADGTGTAFPPGHWMLFGQFCSLRDAHSLDMDVKMFFALANAMLDASIVTWEEKRHFDSVRPITAVRYLYRDRRVRAWAGPYQGTREIDGARWRPYLPTPPFPEYVSGHSTFSSAGAEILRLVTGHADFGATVTVPAGSSKIEPGTTPAHAVVLSWPTFDTAATEAGFSRRLGGIHFTAGDLNGRTAGRKVAAVVWAKAQQYFLGAAGTDVTPRAFRDLNLTTARLPLQAP